MLNYWLIIEFYLQSQPPSKSAFLGTYVFLVSSAILVLFLIIIIHAFNKHFCMEKFRLFLSYLKLKLSFEAERVEDSDEDLLQAANERDQGVDTY